ncbi:MAG TPA: hypothetical protein VK524_28395 [Polyangiaceae bacterium]|nr:hypothetical protein [Polyangiaceae bacterium]
MRTNESAPRELASDTRGAVLVIGIVVAGMLAYGIYHLAETGKAIVFREQGQSVADSAAFSSAVFHAQGMNALVALNIVMSVAMAVLITWRVLELAVGLIAAALAIACLASPFLGGATSFACPLAPRVTQWGIKMAQKDPKISRNVMKVCAGINVLEKLVATAAPPIAMGYSMASTWGYYNPNWVLTLSPSLAPPPLPDMNAAGLKKLLSKEGIKEKITECFEGHRRPAPGAGPGSQANGSHGNGSHGNGGHGEHSPAHTWNEVSQQRMGLIFSLPAQEDHLGKLCSKAGNLLDPIVLKWAKGTPIEEAAELLSKFKGELFGMVPSLFCSPSDTLYKEAVDDLDAIVAREARDNCERVKKEFRKLPDEERKQHPYYNETTPRGGRPNYGHFDRTKCEDEAKKEAKKNQVDRDAQRRAQDQVLECVKPARVWEPSRNGNVFMQSFSWANIDAAIPTPGPKEPPSMGPAPPASAPPPPPPVMGPAPETRPTTIRAQAEMYFDCKGYGGKPADWREECDPYAMWKFKWKARLRTVQSFSEMANEAVASALAAGFAIGAQELFMEKIYHGRSGFGFDTKYGTATNQAFYPLQEALRDLFMDNIEVSPAVIH